MRKLLRNYHQRISDRSPRYKAWHAKSYATHTHAGILGVFLFTIAKIVASILVASFISTPVLAATQTWTSESDWSGWSKSNTSATNISGSLTLATNGGSSWSNNTSPTTNSLNAVWAASGNDAWAVGDSGTIVHYNGTGWSTVTSPTSQNLRAIWGSSASDIWAVGGTTLHGGTVIHYNGSSWELYTIPLVDWLYAICGSSANDVLAIGAQGGTSKAALKWNGSTWTDVRVASGFNSYAANALTCTSSTNYWSGGQAIFTTSEVTPYNGSTWGTATGFSDPVVINALWSISASDIWGVGAGASYKIIHYNGSSWTAVSGASATTLNGVWGSASDNVWAVGASGTLWQYNGSSWSNVSSPNTSTTLYGVYGAGGNIWAVGSGGSIISYAPAFQSSGYAYQNYDAGETVDWNTITKSETTNGQTITYYAKTATSSGCDNAGNSWTGWAQLSFSGNDADISSWTNTRYLCLGINLSTSDTSTSPQVDALTLTYSTISSGGGSGGSSTPTPTPSPAPSTSTTTGGSIDDSDEDGGGDEVTVITKITTDSCTSVIKDITLQAQDTAARISYAVSGSRTSSWYIYPESRATSATKPATGYDTNSIKVDYGSVTPVHDLITTGLKPETKYYYTIQANASGSLAKAVSCEHDFTTPATQVSNRGAITGNVYLDGTTTPIPGVRVSFHGQQTGGPWRQEAAPLTGESGGFSFEYIPGLNYQVSIQPGFLPAGYLFGFSKATSSCPSYTVAPNAIVWEKTTPIPSGGCRVSLYLTKIQSDWPTISGNVLRSGTSIGAERVGTYLYMYVGNTAQKLSWQLTNDKGEWSYQYPPGTQIAVLVPSAATYTNGPSKAVPGCPNADTIGTTGLAWRKKLLPAVGGCAGNKMFITYTQGTDRVISGVTKDAVTGETVGGIRLDLYDVTTPTNRKNAGRVYSNANGEWRFLGRPDVPYEVEAFFDANQTLGYLFGPSVISTSCSTSTRTTSKVRFGVIPEAGCQDTVISLNPLRAANSYKIAGYAINALNNTPVGGTQLILNTQPLPNGTINSANMIVGRTTTRSDGSWEFYVIPGEKYYVEMLPRAGYLAGLRLAQTACKADSAVYVYRLTWYTNKLTGNCEGNVIYQTPADGKISGTSYLTNSITALNNSYLRLFQYANRVSDPKKKPAFQYNYLTNTYSNINGKFGLDCRIGEPNYYVMHAPSLSSILTPDLGLIGDNGERRGSHQRTSYVAVRPDECRVPQPLDLTVAISPTSGTFDKTVSNIVMTYSSSVQDHPVEIHYTINGEKPTLQSPRYRRALSIGRLSNVSGDQQVKIRAVAFGSESQEAEATYTLSAPPAPTPSPTPSPTPTPTSQPTATPTPQSTSSPTPSPTPTAATSPLDVAANPPGGDQSEPIQVTLTSNPSSGDIQIFYTADGSDPVQFGNLYASPLTFNASTVLTYYAKNVTTSEQTIVKTDVYTFPVILPVIIEWDPDPGVDPVYTVNCNGEPIATTQETSFIDPVRRDDGCAYTITGITDDGKPIDPITNPTVKPAKNLDVTELPLSDTAAMAAAIVAAIPLAQAATKLPDFLSYAWLSLLMLLGVRKRGSSSGRVVSATTGQGIFGAWVTFVDTDRYNRVVGRTFTDRNGNFNFISKPGTYVLQVTHANYLFPSGIRKDGYHGEQIQLIDREIIGLEVPMDESNGGSKFWQSLKATAFQLASFNMLVIILGLGLIVYSLLQGVTWFNLVLTAYYVIITGQELRTVKQARHVIKVVGADGKPAAHAIVRLSNAQGQVVVTQATDVEGQVYVLTRSGDYSLSVTPPADAPAAAPKPTPIRLRRGILTKTVIVHL